MALARGGGGGGGAPKPKSGPMIDPNSGKSLIKATPKPVPQPTKPKGSSKVSNKGSITAEDTYLYLLDRRPLEAEPDVPASTGSSSSSSQDIKAATPDLIQITEEGMSIEVITDLLFEDIGGTEILNIARHDLINGIDIKYQQISNLVKIENIFGGSNLIGVQNPIEQTFGRFALKRYQYVPATTSDPSGLDNHIYVDESGNVNLELYNLEDNMQIEIEFKSADTTDIIY
jgi:hypothetical protein